jgi:hypothetical protein
MLTKLKIESHTGNLRIVENAIDNITNKYGINQESYGKIMVAVLEAVIMLLYTVIKLILRNSLRLKLLREKIF